MSGLPSMKREGALLLQLVLAVVVASSLYICCGCARYDGSPSKPEASSSASAVSKSTPSYGPSASQATPRTYSDNRWPTFNEELLAIPESNRWYNAWSSVGSTCTIAGPVVNVYQAQDSAGMPIFIDIGSAYPNPDSVTLVIWGDQYYDFADMINAVDDGGAWLSVTGYLGTYNGFMQFDAGEGYIEYTWWTSAW